MERHFIFVKIIEVIFPEKERINAGDQATWGKKNWKIVKNITEAIPKKRVFLWIFVWLGGFTFKLCDI